MWDTFADPDELGRARLRSMKLFLGDFERGKREQRYVTAALPSLPFADGQFGLCLSSHLLFLYSAQLDLQFHAAAFQEMLRVASEVRVFPLLALGGNRSPHVEPITAMLRADGFMVIERTVGYEVQRGANQVLIVRRGEEP